MQSSALNIFLHNLLKICNKTSSVRTHLSSPTSGNKWERIWNISNLLSHVIRRMILQVSWGGSFVTSKLSLNSVTTTKPHRTHSLYIYICCLAYFAQSPISFPFNYYPQNPNWTNYLLNFRTSNFQNLIVHSSAPAFTKSWFRPCPCSYGRHSPSIKQHHLIGSPKVSPP